LLKRVLGKAFEQNISMFFSAFPLLELWKKNYILCLLFGKVCFLLGYFVGKVYICSREIIGKV